jgi:ornithine decarboxylase
MTDKIRQFLADCSLETPFLAIDLDFIAEKYRTLRHHLPDSHIYYAVKANPAPEVLRLFVELGANFDSASIFEIEQCLAAGATPERISFGNTIKKGVDIARAHALGIDCFCFDSYEELQKLATHAPGARVYCRFLTHSKGAEWPLERKFGCEPNMVYDLLLLSHDLGLVPYGVSFHVGSQQTDATQWDAPISVAALLFSSLAEEGIHLQMVNMGGGFPGHYRTPVLEEQVYADEIQQSLVRHFGDNLPVITIEPGRSLVADAGIIQAEVVLVSQKSYQDAQRWVYLDIGKFGGLIETMDECIKYRIRTSKDGEPTGPVVLAGPTCDSADILYEKTGYELPLTLQSGDKVEIQSTGAYTYSYSSICFNGLPPLKMYCI